MGLQNNYMGMENMFGGNKEATSNQEVINSAENLVSEGSDIESSINNSSAEVKNKKASKIGAFITTLTAGGVLGAYNLSESFQATLNNKIQALQNIDWESAEVIKNASLTAGGIAVTGLAVAIMKMKRAYEKQQNGLAS